MRANWQNEIVEWASDTIGRELVWGETDCASLVFHVVSTAYNDPNIHSDPPESLSEAVERFGEGETPSEWLKSLGAAPEENLHLAQRGDIAIIEDDEFDLQAAGVCLGFGEFMVSNSESGVVRVSTEALPEDSYIMRLPDEVNV